MIHINLFIYGCGHHNAAWRHPKSHVEELGDISYYQRLAKQAEDAKLDALFFSDSHIADHVSDGPRRFLEPLTTLAAISQTTEHIGLVSTISSTLYTPYHAARLVASLDHISKGRMGWNVVTSLYDNEARNHGFDQMPPHHQRYARAEEFIQTVWALWDSWAKDALILDRQGHFADPAKVQPIHHQGEFFKVEGPLNVPHPPQGRPVLFQAGSSAQGREMAANYADAIFGLAEDEESAFEFASDIAARSKKAGRAKGPCVMPGMLTYVGSTEEEAQNIRRELDDLVPLDPALKRLGQLIRQDCSGWDADAPVPPLPPIEEFAGEQGQYATILRLIEKDKLTVRQLVGRMAAGRGHWTVIGTPEQVASQMEDWYRHGAAGGFNWMPPDTHRSVTDFTENVIPILVERGLFRKDYVAGETLRERFGR